jgi:hypothetical protein
MAGPLWRPAIVSHAANGDDARTILPDMYGYISLYMWSISCQAFITDLGELQLACELVSLYMLSIRMHMQPSMHVRRCGILIYGSGLATLSNASVCAMHAAHPSDNIPSSQSTEPHVNTDMVRANS